jgi:hypothetical protein
MIESEEKRKRIIENLERWSKHCKVDHLLRDGDIEGLANSIIQEFYHIQLCCGHWVREFNEGVTLEMPDYSDGEKGISSGIYCKDCAKQYLKEIKGCRVIK